jgi:hypothetical protein
VRDASLNSSASSRAAVNPDDSLTKQASIPLTPFASDESRAEPTTASNQQTAIIGA